MSDTILVLAYISSGIYKLIKEVPQQQPAQYFRFSVLLSKRMFYLFDYKSNPFAIYYAHILRAHGK